jgi:hypothetical protein
MIDIRTEVLGLHRRVVAGGHVAHSVTLRLDEGPEPSTVRISREHHDEIEAAMASGRRFVVSIRIAAPSLGALAERETTGGAA